MLKQSLILAALVAMSGCDPRSPTKEAPKVSALPQPDTFRAEVLFDFERAELGGEGRKLLDELARELVASDIERLTATAHTDRIGGAAYNEELAARRAEAIRDYLVGKGVPVDLLQVEGKGAREPVTAGRCDGLGPENKQNAKLIACLEPDRRAEIGVRRRAAR